MLDPLEQLAKDSLSSGMSILVRPVNVRDGQCLASTPEVCDGLREWMLSKKASAERNGVDIGDFVMEVVDKHMVVRSVLWQGEITPLEE